MKGEIFSIDNKAEELLNNYGFENQYPLKIVSLANAMGLKVYYAEFNDSNIVGAISKKDNPPAIYINYHDNHTRQRFTVAHEIAHFYLHMNNDDVPEIIDMYRGGDYSKEEYEANMFAAALLMNADEVKKQYHLLEEDIDLIKEKKLFGDRIYEELISKRLASYFGVSRIAMRMRLNTLGLIRSV